MGRTPGFSSGQEQSCILVWSSFKSHSLAVAPALRGSPRRFLGWDEEVSCYLMNGAVHITMVLQPSFLKHKGSATLPSWGMGSSWSRAVSFCNKLPLQGRGEGRRGLWLPSAWCRQPWATIMMRHDCFFILSAKLYKQNKISCRGLLTYCLWLLYILI